MNLEICHHGMPYYYFDNDEEEEESDEEEDGTLIHYFDEIAAYQANQTKLRQDLRDGLKGITTQKLSCEEYQALSKQLDDVIIKYGNDFDYDILNDKEKQLYCNYNSICEYCHRVWSFAGAAFLCCRNCLFSCYPCEVQKNMYLMYR